MRRPDDRAVVDHLGAGIEDDQADVTLELGELVIAGAAAGVEPLEDDGADIPVADRPPPIRVAQIVEAYESQSD